MSIKDRLTRKTEGLLVPERSDNKPAGSTTAPLRTGPGQMLMVNKLTKESNQRIAQLEERVNEFEGALPVRRIAADKISPSKWANRIEHSFQTAEFAALKDEIGQAGGNVQPIKVRPLEGEGDRFEVVFGHRRHRACSELGLDVLAMIEAVDDTELFKAMDRENRERLDLSPWEQGKMYRTALKEGLFGSIGELAREVGIDKGNLSKALALADLPDAIVAAFPSPLDLQFRWSKLLNDALQQDPEAVLKRAEQLASDRGVKRTAKDVLGILTGVSVSTVASHPIKIGGKAVGKMVSGPKGVSVEFSGGVLSAEQIKNLPALLEKFLRE